MAKVGRMLKEGMVEELTNQLSKQPNVFVTRVNRLTGSDADVLRRKLHAARARFVMVKRRIGLRTFEQLNLSAIRELLEGSVSLVLTSDEAAPIAKELVEFVKAHEGQLTVRGAWIDGQVFDQGRVETLAKLPPRPMLLAQVVGTVEWPLSDLIFTIERLIGDLAWVIEQAATKKQATGQGTAGEPEAQAITGTPQTGAAPVADASPPGESTVSGEQPSKGQGEGPEAAPEHEETPPHATREDEEDKTGEDGTKPEGGTTP